MVRRFRPSRHITLQRPKSLPQRVEDLERVCWYLAASIVVLGVWCLALVVGR